LRRISLIVVIVGLQFLIAIAIVSNPDVKAGLERGWNDTPNQTLVAAHHKVAKPKKAKAVKAKKSKKAKTAKKAKKAKTSTITISEIVWIESPEIETTQPSNSTSEPTPDSDYGRTVQNIQQILSQINASSPT